VNPVSNGLSINTTSTMP